MPLYTVLAPPAEIPDGEPDPVGFVFVKDGFCWPCLFVPELWLIFRRLWLVLLIYLAVWAGLFIAIRTVGGPLPALAAVFWHFFFALQANGFRRWTLRRHGYRLVGVAEGRRVGEAEMRFFHEMENPLRDPRQPPPARLSAALRGGGTAGDGTPRGPTGESREIVGLFPSPGGAAAP